MEVTKLSHSSTNSSVVTLNVEYTEIGLMKEIVIDSEILLSDISRSPAILDQYEFLVNNYPILRDELKNPPSIYIKINDTYMKAWTISRSMNAFGPVIISIPAFNAPLGKKAIDTHQVYAENLIKTKFQTETLILSIEKLQIRENFREDEIINQHVKKGHIFKKDYVEEMFQKLEKRLDDKDISHRKEINAIKTDISKMKTSHKNDIEALKLKVEGNYIKFFNISIVII